MNGDRMRPNFPQNRDLPVTASSNTEGDDARQIRRDIESTRAEMGSTIDAIQERLSPQHVIDEVKESVREATIGKVKEIMNNVTEATKDAGSAAMMTVRRNPVPYILIGSGVGLLLANKLRGNGSNGYGNGSNGSRHTVKPFAQSSSNLNEPGVMDKAQTAIGGALSTVQEKAGDVAGQAREQVTRLSNQVKDGATQATNQVRQAFTERPLIVGGVALVAGALVALTVPTTGVEQEYLGEAREKLMEKAQDVAKSTLHKIEDAVEPQHGAAQPQTARM